MNHDGNVSPDVFQVDPLDWAAIMEAKPNVLICGESMFIDSFLHMLSRHCAPPLRRIAHSGALGSLSNIGEGTVVLENADRYNVPDQKMVLDWIAYTGAGIQVITTTGNPLFDLVEQGQFLTSLFYRINTVYLELSCPAEGNLPIWRASEHRVN
jgi:Sigma-54 interaction domain